MRIPPDGQRPPTDDGARPTPDRPPAETTPPEAAPTEDTAREPSQELADQPAPFDEGLQDFADPTGFAGAQIAYEGAAGVNTAMLGRADIANRNNLFDTMLAVPSNRVWLGFQHVHNFNNAIELTDNGAAVFDSFDSDDNGLDDSELDSLNEALTDAGQPRADILERQQQQLYRFGLELMLTPWASVAVQGQYHASDSVSTPSEFETPQAILKYAIWRGCRSTTSLMLGVEPENDGEQFSIAETHTRLYPGLLYYYDSGAAFFGQAGAQVSVPLADNQTTSLDWALSAGLWIWGEGVPRYCSSPASLIGATVQAELFGHHVLGDSTVLGAFGIPADSDTDLLGGDGSAIFVFEEPNSIIDGTFGATFFFGCGMRLAVAGSFPLSEGDAREGELITTLVFTF